MSPIGFNKKVGIRAAQYIAQIKDTEIRLFTSDTNTDILGLSVYQYPILMTSIQFLPKSNTVFFFLDWHQYPILV